MKRCREYDSETLEAAVAAAGESFTVSGLVKKICGGESAELRARLERKVENDPALFCDERYHCRRRESFFRGRQFLITPMAQEIAMGILVPGHRFVPYVSPEVFPCEVTLELPEGPAGSRLIVEPLAKIVRTQVLLGMEQLRDYLVADHLENQEFFRQGDITRPVRVTVYDLEEFYRANRFTNGDALLCRVEDYTGGRISCRMLHRQVKPETAAMEALDLALTRVWEEYGDATDIPEQLAQALYRLNPAGYLPLSLEEYISFSEGIVLKINGGQSLLMPADEAAELDEEEAAAAAESAGADAEEEECGCGHHHHRHEEETGRGGLPAGLSLTSAELEDVEKILAGGGFPLSLTEVEGYMLEAISARETDFSAVYSRIFGRHELDLDDDVQQAALLNQLEDIFETLSENYNRVDDEPKAALRGRIVEAAGRRLNYLLDLRDLERALTPEEEAGKRQLTAAGAALELLLKQLNDPLFLPDETELDAMEEAADRQFARIDSIIEEQ